MNEARTAKDSPSGRPWLSVVALLSFIPAFAASRIFTYFLPKVVVEQSGIHFHHFWYGLILIAGAGWLGLAGPASLARFGAVMYGLGGGVLADEFGLLLTLGDYQTGITYTLVVGMVVTAASCSLVHHYRSEIVTELKRITLWEKVAILGLFLLLFPLALVTFGIPTDAVGLVIAGAYRTRFGGAWKISQRRFFLELSGIAVSVVILVLAGSVVSLIFQSVFGAFPPPQSILIPVLLGLFAVDVFSGLVGGWIWSSLLRRDSSNTFGPSIYRFDKAIGLLSQKTRVSELRTKLGAVQHRRPLLRQSL